MEIRKTEAGIDWVTATLPRSVTVHEAAGFEAAVSFAASEGCHGEQRRKRGLLGYRGWCQGSITYGDKLGEQLVMATGGAANSVFGHVNNSRIHVSRLDLAITCWLAADCSTLAQAFARAAAVSREAGVIKANTRIGLYDGYGNGDTCYIGSKTSEKMLRVYDKWRESGEEHYKWAWRFELQLRNDAATIAWRQLKGMDDYRKGVGQLVTGYLVERGLSTFQHMGYYGDSTIRFYSKDYVNRQEVTVAPQPSCPYRQRAKICVR